jgi:hypothetical protein
MGREVLRLRMPARDAVLIHDWALGNTKDRPHLSASVPGRPIFLCLSAYVRRLPG